MTVREVMVAYQVISVLTSKAVLRHVTELQISDLRVDMTLPSYRKSYVFFA